jgi:hypothetical protein
MFYAFFSFEYGLDEWHLLKAWWQVAGAGGQRQKH